MSELVDTLAVSLDLSRLAVYYDSKEKYVPAIHYYDLCLIHLDETLIKLPVNSVESEKVVALRNQYQDRMVYLRRFSDILSKTQKDDNSTTISSQEEVTSKDRYLQNDENTLERRRRQSCVRFDPKLFGQSQDSLQIMDVSTRKSIADRFEKPPKSAQSLPYWQLGRISQSIHSGSLLSEHMYIPKHVWVQYDTRFAGIQVKIGAYRDVIDMMKKNVEVLIIQYDIKRISSLEKAKEIELTDNELQDLAQTLKLSRNEFMALQNQLSRAFSYIEEVQIEEDSSSSNIELDGNEGVEMVEETDDSLQLSNNLERLVTPVIREEEMMHSPKVTASKDLGDKDVPENSRMSSIMGGLTLEALGNVGGAIGGVVTSGMNQGISLVGSLGKNAKKYAEVGLSRIGAMYSKVTHEELDTYTALVSELADKMQYFDDIFHTVERYRSILIEKEETNEDAKVPRKVAMTETILTQLLHISKFTKDVLCNLILRDLQDLLSTYLAKRNKELLAVEYLEETSGALNSAFKSFNLGGQEE